MFRNVMVAVLTCVAFSGTAAAQQVLTPERAIPDQYIVVFDDAQTARTQVAAEAQALARQHGGRILHIYQDGLRGFAAAMSATAAAALARNPRVRYVEQDSVMTIVATPAERHLGARSHRPARPAAQQHLHLRHHAVERARLHHRHRHPGDARGVRRPRDATAITAINDGNGTNDCNGHGTHVAGTVGGATYGVAKGVDAARRSACSTATARARPRASSRASTG